ncbi:hypothetical protein Tco_0991361 [Tanacetum coccineum]|uniref:Uncharacterized protein n=1 Tax=Tanacetum coccineum TaxID=301880 RepID=A0ABQ5F0T2_9ASTR
MDRLLIRNEEVRFAAKCGLLLLLQIPLRALTDIVRRFVNYIKASYLLRMADTLIMSITKEQQQALDDALVPREQRLQIGTFLITASVPAIYMHEFWTFASYHKHSIRFKLNTKRYSFDLDTFRNMLQICPKLPGQQFVDPPFEEEILTFMRELGYPGNIKLLSDVKVDILP